MTEQVQTILSDADKELIAQFKKEQSDLKRSIFKTDQSMTLLQRRVAATLGTDTGWIGEATRHFKMAFLMLQASVNDTVTVDILKELRKRKAILDKEAAELAALNAQQQNDENVIDADFAEIAKLAESPHNQENLPVQENPAEGQAV